MIWPTPIVAQLALASMVVSRPGMEAITVPLYAESGVGAAGFGTRLKRATAQVLDLALGSGAEPVPAAVPLPAQDPVVPGSALTN